MRCGRNLMLLGMIIFSVTNVVLWIHVIRQRRDARGMAEDRDAVVRDFALDLVPTRHHRRRRHHGHTAAPLTPAGETTAPALTSEALDEDGQSAQETHEPHHRKKKGGDYNLNDPDDMKPKDTVMQHLFLKGSSNRSFAAFIVVGDWGGPGRDPQRDVAAAMDRIAGGRLKDLFKSDSTQQQHFIEASAATGSSSGSGESPRRSSQVDFIVSTGDNMYEDGVKDEFDPKFQRNFEHVYNGTSLQNLRWYIALGNHDHGAHGVMRDVRGQVRYTNRSARWFLPSTYYTQLFDVEVSAEGDALATHFSIQLIVLDTYDVSPYMTKMSKNQLLWFERTLQESTADWKFVVGHRPILSAGAKHGSSPYLKTRLMPLMTKYRVTAYMCGDDHELQVLESGGVLHLLSGGGARAKSDLKKHGLNETLFQAGVHGFMTVTLSKEALGVSVHDKTGAVLWRHDRNRPT